MKCIKKHGEIKRVRDAEASNLVNNEDWIYCPKKEWKEYKNSSKKDTPNVSNND